MRHLLCLFGALFMLLATPIPASASASSASPSYGSGAASLNINGVCSAPNKDHSFDSPAYGLCSTAHLSWTCAANSGGAASCRAPRLAAGSFVKPGPSAALFNAPFYHCLRNFYVATNGSDSNAGTKTSPWLTIRRADNAMPRGGDCINVAPGTYNGGVLIQYGGNAPTPTGYVAYRCETLDGCHVLATTLGHVWGFEKQGNFVVVDGFDIDGNSAIQAGGVADACLGTDDHTYGARNAAHHLWFLNNVVHNCNLAGLSISGKEWYYAIHNRVYDNSFTSPAQGSGIGFVVIECIERGNPSCYSGSTYVPSGMDLTFAPPFHNVVSGNDVHNNMIAPYNSIGCGHHTDGNGIIMDTFYDLVTNTIAYPYQTLILGNASYANGGHGVHIFRSSYISVANNTIYGNGTDTCNNAYYMGDISESGGANNVWVNNIAQSILTNPNPSCGQFCGGRNAPIVAGDGGGVADLNTKWLDNVTYGGLGVQLFNNDATVPYFTCKNNRCNTSPLLVNPSVADFFLQPNSPAIGYVTPEQYLPRGTIDAGAYQ